MDESQPEHFVGTETIARHLGVNIQTVLVWVRTGRIPCFRIGARTLRFRISEVESAIKAQQVRP